MEALKVNKFVFDPSKTYTPIKDVLSTISMLLNTKLPVIGWNLRPFILPTIVHESIRHNVPMPNLSDLETLDLTPIAAKSNAAPCPIRCAVVVTDVVNATRTATNPNMAATANNDRWEPSAGKRKYPATSEPTTEPTVLMAVARPTNRAASDRAATR